MTRFHKNGSDSARKAFAVTPSDTVNYATGPARGLYVGTGGTVVLLPVDNSAVVTLTGVPSGVVLPIWHARVNATSTTATGLVALYD